MRLVTSGMWIVKTATGEDIDLMFRKRTPREWAVIDRRRRLIKINAKRFKQKFIKEVKPMKTLYSKILEAQKALGYVAKNGKNTFNNYNYAMESDILGAVKKAANDVGLVIVTSALAEIGETENAKNERMHWAKVTLLYKVVDAETGDMVEGQFEGYAQDKGDKSIYKATTGANKYFLMKFFGVATGDDPENDTHDQQTYTPPIASGPQKVPHTSQNPNEMSKQELDRKKNQAMARIQDKYEYLGITKQQAEVVTGLTISKREGLDTLYLIENKLTDFEERCKSGELTNKELEILQQRSA